MGRKRIYLKVVYGNDTICVISEYAGMVTLYGAAGERIKRYVSDNFKSKAFVDTRFIKDGIYLNPNKVLVAKDTGVYTMEVYTKDS